MKTFSIGQRSVTVLCLVVATAATSILHAVPPPPVGTLETLILFDPQAGETPESIVFDRSDTAYISLAFRGEIRKVEPPYTAAQPLAFLPIGTCDPSIPAVTLGLTIDRRDRLYVAVSSCDPANQGIWRVDTDDGSIELVAPAPAGTVINGIDIDNRYLYGADTFGGLIWRAPKEGGDLEIWSDDPLLDIPPGSPFPGPNGLKVFRREVLVANSSTGNIVAIPIQPNGTAGAAAVRGTLPAPQGGDEFAIDVHGSIYCTTDPFQTLVRLDPDGTTEILLTAADLLDGPTSAAFGRRGKNRKNLYITNGAFPIFGGVRPSLMRLRLAVPGAR
jgi:sugar lactone lactonase YvrE